MRNIELKARLDDLAAARCVAETLATDRPGVQRQTDTYFHCRQGRLKLREVEGLESQLVWYARDDREGPKPSEYQLVAVPDPTVLKAALTAALGIRAVVRKRREIFLYHNVRIHLDEVEGLGRFIEFEAVLGPGLDDATGHAQIAFLMNQFRVGPGDLLPRSYAEMVEIT